MVDGGSRSVVRTAAAASLAASLGRRASRRALRNGLALVLILSMLGGGAGGSAKRRRGKTKAPAGQGDGTKQGAGAAAPGGVGGGTEDVMETYDQFCGAALVEKGLGNTDQAIQLLGTTIAQVPNISVGWLELGAMFGAVGDTQLAHRCLRSAERLDSQDTNAAKLIHELASRGRLPPIFPAIELESPAGGDDAAAEHQNRYKRRLYERYYMLDCRLRRLRQTLNLRPDSVGDLLAAAEGSGELLYHRYVYVYAFVRGESARARARAALIHRCVCVCVCARAHEWRDVVPQVCVCVCVCERGAAASQASGGDAAARPGA